MFRLKIFSLDYPQRLVPSAAAAGSSSPRTSEIKGLAHLFRRRLSSPGDSTLTLDSSNRTTILFIPGVPNHITPADFAPSAAKKGDATKDFYSVIVTQPNQLSADRLFCEISSKIVNLSQICHVYYIGPVEYMHSAELASIPPPGFSVLPTYYPVCTESLDNDTSAIGDTLSENTFDCPCQACGLDSDDDTMIGGVIQICRQLNSIADEYSLLSEHLEGSQQEANTALAELKDISTTKAVDVGNIQQCANKLKLLSEEVNEIVVMKEECSKKLEDVQKKHKEAINRINGQIQELTMYREALIESLEKCRLLVLKKGSQ